MRKVDFPLFPLKMVLFPNVPILLHIFEDRYQKMIRHCVDKQQEFGVVLEDEQGTHGLAKSQRVGCSAEIVTIQRLRNGRMNVAAVGKKRFRILSTNYVQPYLQGEVEFIPLDGDRSDSRLQKAGEMLRPCINQYIMQLQKLVDIQVNWEGLPDDPVELAYLAAYILQIDPQQKQLILEQDTPLDLLRFILREYAIEQHALKTVLALRRLYPDSAEKIFSLN
ncbi:MAG TPA: hypothetical protein ENJ56_01565 [Anaerolineae bacterium]|nr:hypothetical protein [Anaerolineae bacterium]